MSSQFGLVFKVIEVFERWTGRQKQARVKREQARTAAVAALLDAVTETTAYRADRRSGIAVDRKRELKIAKLWNKAALQVYPLDKRLSSLLATTSLGWSDRELWKTPEFKNAAPKLDVIRQQCLWLLANGD